MLRIPVLTHCIRFASITTYADRRKPSGTSFVESIGARCGETFRQEMSHQPGAAVNEADDYLMNALSNIKPGAVICWSSGRLSRDQQEQMLFVAGH